MRLRQGRRSRQPSLVLLLRSGGFGRLAPAAVGEGTHDGRRGLTQRHPLRATGWRHTGRCGNRLDNGHGTCSSTFGSGTCESGEPCRQTPTLCLSGGSPELRQGGPDAGFGGLTQHQRDATRTQATQQEPVGSPPIIVRSTRASTATKRGTQHQRVRSDHSLVSCGQRGRSTRCKHNLTRNSGTHHLISTF